MSKVHMTLERMGLSKKEVEIYLLLLSTGQSPASIIGKRAGIPKSTARYICQSLVQKGFVALTCKDETFLYTPEPPEKMKLQLERQKEKISRQQEEAEQIVGDLKAMMNPSSMLPKVRFYEGADGVAEAYHSMLLDIPEGGELLSYVHPVKQEDLPTLPRVDGTDAITALQQFIDGRMQKKISTRVIALRCPQAELLKARDAHELRTTRIVDDLPHNGSAVEIFLYGEHVFFVSAQKGMIFACIVQNTGIASLHRAMFEVAWKGAAQ